MKQYSWTLAALACLGTNVSSGSELLPPPYVAITIEAQEIEDTRVEVGKRYMIYIATLRDGSYSALLVGEDGVEVHDDLPVQVRSCDDTSLRWPDSAGAQVRSTTDAAVAQLVVFPVRLNPCLIQLDLPIAADNTLPARPTPGIPK